MPWTTLGPYDADPSRALAKAQEQYFDHNYDLVQYIQNTIKSAEDCVQACQENDTYNLRDTYSTALRAVRKLAKNPIPEDRSAQIELVRDLAAVRGNSLDNILDITGVASEVREWKVFPLPDEMLLTIFGTTKPTELYSDRALCKVYDYIDRAQCVSFNLYRQRKPQRPWGVRYVGYTAD